MEAFSEMRGILKDFEAFKYIFIEVEAFIKLIVAEAFWPQSAPVLNYSTKRFYYPAYRLAKLR
jgi:hypothetical protein